MERGDAVCHSLTGETGVIQEIGHGTFQDWLRVRWDISGEVYFHKPGFITDIFRSPEIRRAHRKNRPLPDEPDHE